MNKAFEEIIEKLEKLSDELYKAYCIGFNSDDRAEYDAYVNAIDIVKQEAENYKSTEQINCSSDSSTGGWIPSSESLPCESGYYLVTYHEWSNGDYLPKYDDTYVRRLHYQRSEHFVGWNYPHCVDEMAEADTNREVVAWMNLPAPYQPKGE